MRQYILCTHFWIMILCGLILLPGCSPALDPFVGADFINQDLVQKKKVKNKKGIGKLQAEIDTRSLSIEELARLATLLQLRYQAAIRGDVYTQRAVQLSLIAMLTAATSVLLFDGKNADALKGLALGTGAIYATGQTIFNSERRKIYNAAAEAYGCIAKRIIAFSPVSFAADGYYDTASDVRSNFTTLREQYKTTKKNVENFISSQRKKTTGTTNQDALQKNDSAQSAIQEINNDMTSSIREYSTVAPSFSAMSQLNESILQEIITLETTITYELARLEPDFTSFTNSIKGSLSAGYSLGIPSAKDAGEPNRNGNGNGNGKNIAIKSFRQKLTGTDKSQNGSNSTQALSDSTQAVLNSLQAFCQKKEDLEDSIAQFKAYGNLAAINIENGLSTESLSKNCWKYITKTSNLTAKPEKPTIISTENALTTVVISGINGSLNAESTTSTLKTEVKHLTESKALVVLTWQGKNSNGQDKIPVIVYDTSGKLLTLDVTVTTQ